MCREVKIVGLRNSCLIAFLKKIQKQPPEGFCKKVVLENFANFTEKHLCWSIFNKVGSLQPASFLKRDSNSSAFL